MNTTPTPNSTAPIVTVDPGAVVPVVPATPKHLNARWQSLAVVIVSAVISQLQANLTFITGIWKNPNIPHWIGLAGGMWFGVLHYMDTNKVTATNYTTPTADDWRLPPTSGSLR